jgi:hypothetical protein
LLSEHIKDNIQEFANGQNDNEDYDKVEAISQSKRDHKPSHYRGESFGNCLQGKSELKLLKETLPLT